jgi:hypothetical protein
MYGIWKGIRCISSHPAQRVRCVCLSKRWRDWLTRMSGTNYSLGKEEFKCHGSKIKIPTLKKWLVFLCDIDSFSVTKKVKGKVHNLTCLEGTEEEQVGICALSLTSTQCPDRFIPGKKAGTECIGDRTSLKAGLDGCGKSRRHRVSIPRPSDP